MTYPTITLPELLERTAAKSPEATALIYFGTPISYRQLQEQVNRLAAGLQALGVEQGDRMALMMPNCPQFVISYFGALASGRHCFGDQFDVHRARSGPPVEGCGREGGDRGSPLFLPLSGPRSRNWPRLRKLSSPARGSITRSPSAASAHPWRPQRIGKEFLKVPGSTSRRAGDSPLGGDSRPFPRRLSSSGRTPVGHCLPAVRRRHDRNSKGAMLTHANLVVNACQALEWLTPGKSGPEVMIAALPLFHIYAMTCVMIASVLAGGTVIILPASSCAPR